jgi:hypothetical protein
MSYESALSNEALDNTSVEKPSKKSRSKADAPVKSYPQFNEDGTPVLDADGKEVWGPEKSAHKKAKAPRVRKPKVIEYQLDEAGNQVLDEEGNPIPVKKVRAPRLDADGNPIPRQSNVYLDSQVIRLSITNIPNYRAGTKRGDIFASIKDGMTVGEFYEKNGGKSVSHTFLVWYVNEAKVVDVE